MNFGLIGAAGYIASKHMDAIKHVGGELVVAYDVADSVGVLDKYFPKCEFFVDQKKFVSYISKNKIDYLVIYSPNHFHKEHIDIGRVYDIKVICEKPIVIDANDYHHIERKEFIYPVLQFRYSPNAHSVSGFNNSLCVYYVIQRG